MINATDFLMSIIQRYDWTQEGTITAQLSMSMSNANELLIYFNIPHTNSNELLFANFTLELHSVFHDVLFNN